MFGKIFLVLNAVIVTSEAASSSLSLRRGLGVKDDIGTNDSFNENLGQCTGAVCGLWGDPHIITCDGLAYDCQAEGLFTLMKNHWYNIQGKFLSVGAAEMKLVLGWNNYPKATSTNDIIIEVQDDTQPTFQFSYPDLSFAEDGTVPSEEGCLVGLHYMNGEQFNMPGQSRSVETNVHGCQERCASIDGCTHFSFFMDGGCHPQDENALMEETPKSWTRSVSGPVHKCGLPRTEQTLNKDVPPFARVFTNDNNNRRRRNLWGRRNRNRNRNQASSSSGSESNSDSNSDSNSNSNSNSNDAAAAAAARRTEDGGNGCPFLFYVDGVMMDISQVPAGGYLYGDATSDASAKLEGSDKIRVKHKTSTGSFSEAMLMTEGDGPGEIWGCHWNFWVCCKYYFSSLAALPVCIYR